MLNTKSSAVLVAVVMVLVLASCSSDPAQSAEFQDLEAQKESWVSRSSDLEIQLEAAEEQVVEIEAQLTEEVAVLTDQLERVVETVPFLRETMESLEESLADVEAELSAALRSLAEATEGKESAEQLVAELSLAYSREIDAARSTLARTSRNFACSWGTTQATDGKPLTSITGEEVLKAFARSDIWEELSETPSIAAAVSAATTLGEDPYGVGADDVESTAVECWQAEDAKLNAALYQHAGILREAALDAACTHGASNVFSGSYGYPSYDDTAVYQSWQLTMGGYSEVGDYIDSVEDHFLTVERFLAIPDAELQAESDRCDDIRDLIEPKGDGTWNVGTEIRAGTWKAFDVSDCYWARLAVNGGILANHFGDGLRLTVNVRSSDGQLEISRCDFYFANP